MGKPSVALANAAPIPLEEITVRWEQSNYFKSERTVQNPPAATTTTTVPATATTTVTTPAPAASTTVYTR